MGYKDGTTGGTTQDTIDTHGMGLEGWLRVTSAWLMLHKAYLENYNDKEIGALFKYWGLDPNVRHGKDEITAAITKLVQHDPELGAVLLRTQQVTSPGGDNEGGAGGAGTQAVVTNSDGSQTLTLADGTQLTIPNYNPSDGGQTAAEKAAKIRYQRNTQAAFENLLSSYGIDQTANLTTLIDEGVKKHYSQQTFLKYLRQTAEYQDTFAGIFNDDGTMKMSEGQYMAQATQYNSTASQLGINFQKGGRLSDWLFENNVDPQEFADRGQAVVRLRDNPALYDQFSKALQEQGISKKPPTKAELLKFVLGEGNKEWEQLWNLSAARYQATEAGLKIRQGHLDSSYYAIGQKFIESVANKDLTEAELSQRFGALQTMASQVLTQHEAQLFGVGKKTIEKAAFGGKGSARAKDKMQAAMAQAEGATATSAHIQFGPGQGGGAALVGGQDNRKAQSAY